MSNCNKCLLSDNILGIYIEENGQCNFCNLHEKFDTEYKTQEFQNIADTLIKKKNKYDCLIGVSGGMDSSWMLYQSIIKFNLKPLVVHFNNGWNYPVATKNIDSLVSKLGVDYIEYRINNKEYNELNLAFLKASVCDADIPNDIAMTKLFWETAVKYNIKTIFNGHNYKTEGSSPIGWSYMDGAYIQDVYKKFYYKELENYPLLSFLDQIIYGLRGIKTYRPMYYNDFYDINMIEEYPKILEKNIPGFSCIKTKHGENEYTDFIGSYLLPRKFNIDKRLTYLSALIRSNIIDKEMAIKIINGEPNFSGNINNIINKLEIYTEDFEYIMQLEQRPRTEFKTYHETFKKYKFIIWILAKLNILPYTFYLKYTK